MKYFLRKTQVIKLLQHYSFFFTTKKRYLLQTHHMYTRVVFVGNMFIKSFTFHLFEYLITIIGKKFFNGIFFFFLCFFFILLKTLEYGVPVNCSICNVNANFEFILLFPLTICKLSWDIKVIIMADWVIKGIVIQNQDLVLFN